MAESVSIKVFGDDHFVHHIRRIALRAVDASPVMHSIGEDFIDIVEEQFDTEGKRGGHPWRQLTTETISRRGSAHPILIDSGDMFDALITPGNIEASGDGVEMRLPEEVLQRAESAQYGFTARGGNNVRPRKIVDFTAFDKKGFRDKISDWLMNGTV